MRKSKSLNKNNIVIVCEGSETEKPYFEGIKRFLYAGTSCPFSDIHIIPGEKEEAKGNPNRHSGKRQLKKIPNQYYELQEDDSALYKQYNAQPLRYVRECQLFLERNLYGEAWAVYDNDGFPAHQQAAALADSVQGLNIAYSSIAFEEWLLCHFERNPRPFECSDCKKNGKSIACGTHVDPDDCDGNRCVAGRIRCMNYIPDYDKQGTQLFDNVTLPNLAKACMNAAWLRALGNQATPFYERNPYTSVDQLVLRLLERNEHYCWVVLGEEFQLDNARIVISKQNSNLVVEQTGGASIILNSANWIYCNVEGNAISSVLSKNKLLTQGNSTIAIPLAKSVDLLRIKNSSGNTMFFIDVR